MEGFFRRLQEVADLPSQISSGAPGGNGSSAEAAAAQQDLTREDLVDMLAEMEKRALAAEARAETLRAEATDINDQYSAFKVKVNTWREQMKAARAQDRRTIDALRQAATTAIPTVAGSAADGSGGDGSTSGASGGSVSAAPSVDASYVASLEEQVGVLKETIRQHAAQRDELQVELDRMKDRAKRELQAASDASSAASGGAGGAAGATSGSSPTDTDKATTLKYMVLVERLEKEASAWAEKYAALERTNETLTAEVDRANVAAGKLTEEHARQLRDAVAAAQRTTSAQYVKDLETELAAYRRQLADSQDTVVELKNALAAASSIAPTEKSSEPQETLTAAALPVAAALLNHEPSASQRQMQRQIKDLEAQVAKLGADLTTTAAELAKQRNLVHEMEAESEIREESFSSVFAETKVLRDRVETLRADMAAAEAERTRLEDLCIDREATIAAFNERVDDLHKALEQSTRQLTKAQRELNEKSEQLRQYKLLDVQRKVEDASHAKLQQVMSNGAPLAAGSVTVPVNSNSSSGGGGKDGGEKDSSMTPDVIIAARLHTMAFATKYRQVAQLGHQVWSSARLRSYAVAAALLLLMMVFTFSQGEVIIEDTATAELIRRCKDLTRAAADEAPSAKKKASDGGLDVVGKPPAK